MRTPQTPVEYRTCGYKGHVCHQPIFSGRGVDIVQFIRRYHHSSDYCVAGKRVQLADEGILTSLSRVTAAEQRAIEIYLLNEYASYCKWHAEQRLFDPLWPALKPFSHKLPLTRMEPSE